MVINMLKIAFLKILGTIRNKLGKSISYKLFIIYMIVISVPVLAYGILSYSLSASTVESDFIQYKQGLNTQIVKNIDDNYLNLQKQFVSIYLWSDDIKYILNAKTIDIDDEYFTVKKRLNDNFAGLLATNANLSGVTLISADGDIKYSNNKQDPQANFVSVKDEQWFKDALSLKGSPLFMEPHTNDFVFYGNGQTKNTYISIAQAINDPSGSGLPIGVILLDEDSTKFYEYAVSANLNKSELIGILNKSGKLVYNNTNLDDDTKRTFNYVNGLKNQKTLKLKIGRKGNMLITTSEPSQFGFKVISAIPVSELQKKSLFLKNITISVLIVLVFIILLISVIVSNIILIPLRRLMSSFRTLEKGDFNIQVPVRGRDELAQIGKTFNSMVENIKKLISEKYEANLLRKHAELESLQSQINPHFLYNTLTSIKAVIDANENKTASAMVQDLSDLFRYSLNRGRHIVRFHEELEHAKRYLNILQERHVGKYKILYDIDSNVLNLHIPRLTLQPILENAVCHGLEGRKGDGEIGVTAKLSGDKYYVYIYDNGIGITQDKLDKMNELLAQNPEGKNETSEMVGIFNVNARIKFFFGTTYGLKLSSIPSENTVVKVTLPTEYKE